MLATLRLYHDRVDALAREAETLLREGSKAGLPRVAKLRVDQGLAMAAYQLFVHRELFEPLIRTGSPPQIEGAKALKVECVVLSGTFCRHAQYWSKRDPGDEWDDYRAAALSMIAAIRGHIARVQHELAPALALRAAA